MTEGSGRVQREVDVLVVGAGPAGLAAATVLGRVGAGTVEVLDREALAGGIPRHCDHPGFGLRDLRKAWRGATYAEHRTALAQEAGAVVRTGITATARSRACARASRPARDRRAGTTAQRPARPGRPA
jgi:2-polyprenyl-6-methoxyphenol hydroxylase-like FAD-dependent oxidoreductase